MIGKLLKNMRLSANLIQKELAEKLNLADNTISSYERENSQADFDTILRIAKICFLLESAIFFRTSKIAILIYI